jgi:hypothetical protein
MDTEGYPHYVYTVPGVGTIQRSPLCPSMSAKESNFCSD